MNFAAWHFAGVELESGTEMDDGTIPLTVPKNHTFVRSLPFIGQRIDLALPWHASLWEIRSTKEKVHATNMVPAELLVNPFIAIPETKIWMGSSLERMKRFQLLTQKKTKVRKPRQPQNRRIPEAIRDLYDENQLEEEVLALDDHPASDQSDDTSASSEVSCAEEKDDVPSMRSVAKPFAARKAKARKVTSNAPAPSRPSDSVSAEPPPVDAVQVVSSSSTAAAPAPEPKRMVTSKIRTGAEIRFTLPPNFGGSLVFLPSQQYHGCILHPTWWRLSAKPNNTPVNS